eukprot:Skav225230  [mRNA]  locus=scaffold2946:98415:98696:- [translate_table: standard]
MLIAYSHLNFIVSLERTHEFLLQRIVELRVPIAVAELQHFRKEWLPAVASTCRARGAVSELAMADLKPETSTWRRVVREVGEVGEVRENEKTR